MAWSSRRYPKFGKHSDQQLVLTECKQIVELARIFTVDSYRLSSNKKPQTLSRATRHWVQGRWAPASSEAGFSFVLLEDKHPEVVGWKFALSLIHPARCPNKGEKSRRGTPV